jgi:hypothetical protein
MSLRRQPIIHIQIGDVAANGHLSLSDSSRFGVLRYDI